MRIRKDELDGNTNDHVHAFLANTPTSSCHALNQNAGVWGSRGHWQRHSKYRNEAAIVPYQNATHRYQSAVPLQWVTAVSRV